MIAPLDRLLRDLFHCLCADNEQLDTLIEIKVLDAGLT